MHPTTVTIYTDHLQMVLMAHTSVSSNCIIFSNHNNIIGITKNFLYKAPNFNQTFN